MCDVVLRMELDELEDMQRREREYVQMMEEESAKNYEAYRLHHLLSTKQVSVKENERVYTSLMFGTQIKSSNSYTAPLRFETT